MFTDQEFCRRVLSNASPRNVNVQFFRRRLLGALPHDVWKNCDWCGWWGYFSCEVIPEKYVLLDCDFRHMNGIICLRCFELKEPPWRPNNRDRCAAHLDISLGQVLNEVVLRTVAEFLAANEP